MRIELVLERAKPARERNLRRGGEMLIANRNHLMRVEGVENNLEALQRQLFDIGAGNLGGHRRTQLSDFHFHTNPRTNFTM